jgi:hypothetical protein
MQDNSYTLKNALFEYYMENLYGIKVLFVDVLKLHNEKMFILFRLS